jgi:hypothetical protein
MATLSLPTPYTSGSTVTATNLNAHVTAAIVTFTDADTDDSTLEVDTNKFRVKDGGISTAKIAAGAVTGPKAAVGFPVQVVNTATATKQTISATTPLDNTIPQNTEGAEITGLATAITPSSSSNKVLVRVVLAVAAPATAGIIVALHRDSVASAIAATVKTLTDGSDFFVLEYLDSPATTSAVTYKVRVGKTGANGCYVNGSNADASILGGVYQSTLTATEIRA